MSYFKKHELKTTYEEQQIEWKVVNFFSKMDSLRHVQVESRSRKFFYGGSKWAIHLCRDRGSNLWHLFAACDEYGDNMEVESVLALKKVDGSLDESLMQNDGEKYDGYYYIYTCTDEELWEREEELTTSDSLTIVCIMKSGSSYYPVPTFFESPSVKLIGMSIAPSVQFSVSPTPPKLLKDSLFFNLIFNFE